jgi:hypothetical protein
MADSLITMLIFQSSLLGYQFESSLLAVYIDVVNISSAVQRSHEYDPPALLLRFEKLNN